MGTNDNKSFVFYGSWLDEIEDMTAEERLEYYEAIIQYGLFGNVIEMSRYVKGRMVSVRKDLDGSKNHYEEVCQARREAGKKGGRPRKANAFDENQNNQMVLEESKKSINDNDNYNDNDNRKKIKNSFLSKKDDANHNTTGLVEQLRVYHIPDDAIQRICELCDYGVIGHPIWKLLALKRKELNETYITNYISKYTA